MLVPGSTIGRYSLQRLLGRGGMGEVWLAEAASPFGISRPVALKVIGERHADRRARALLYDEARVMTRIQSANVVQAFELGEHDEQLFVVLEWVDGTSLAELLAAHDARGEKLPLDVALSIAIDVAEGLRAAHDLVGDDGISLGLVHRDVAPHNVLVSRDGVAKLSDFGVARMRGRLSGVTGESGLKGRINYLSPEQLRDGPVDARTDLWSFGLVLWQMLEGRLPFEADSGPRALAWLLDLTASPAPPASWPPAIRDIVGRLLSPDPASRPAGAEDVVASLRAAAASAGVELARSRVAAIVATVAPREGARRLTSTPPPTSAPSGSRREPPSTPSAAPRARRGGRLAIVGGSMAVVVVALMATTLAIPRPDGGARPDATKRQPTGAARTLIVRGPETKPDRARPRAAGLRSGCSPPFVIDGAGHKIFLPECLDRAP